MMSQGREHSQAPRVTGSAVPDEGLAEGRPPAKGSRLSLWA
jgi:hypothetical protein